MAVGHVYLVGAGPGDPGLITVKGLQLLRDAQVILHDRLVCEELLEQAHPDAVVRDVGKGSGSGGAAQERINAEVVRYALAGFRVVRLKGGDPFVYGRGFEELQACTAAGVECTVVPGVSSAVAVPALAGIPVTHRGMARSLTIITGHSFEGGQEHLDYGALAKMDTLVILMGLAGLDRIGAELVAAGRSAQTPAACIEKGATLEQRVVRGTLGTIAAVAREKGLAAPVVTVVGEVAQFAGEVRALAEDPRAHRPWGTRGVSARWGRALSG